MNVLVLSTDFGSGHLQAARAVCAACRAEHTDSHAAAVNVDSPWMDLASAAYLSLVNQMPFAWRELYQASYGFGTRRLVRTLLAPAVRREMERLSPSAVAATHPFPGAVAAWMRRQGRLQAPVFMVLTDFLPHPLWVHEGVDRYFVPSPEAAVRLVGLGVSAGRIRITGIPVSPAFGLAQGWKRADRRPHVLVMGGGLGLGPVADAVTTLASLPHTDLQITVVTGSNVALREDLEGRASHNQRLALLGYSDQIPALMAQSDLLVTKPGGVTCSEALACGLPMVLLEPLPGHEEENATYLTATGAAVRPPNGSLGETVADLLLQSPGRLLRMREAALRTGRPEAAVEIANEIFMVSTQNHKRDATA